jgi:hypothetical protein
VSKASAEALLMLGLTVMWLTVSALAFRRARRTGQRSQWRYVALALAAVTLTLMMLNLAGYVFAGPGIQVQSRPH